MSNIARQFGLVETPRLSERDHLDMMHAMRRSGKVVHRIKGTKSGSASCSACAERDEEIARLKRALAVSTMSTMSTPVSTMSTSMSTVAHANAKPMDKPRREPGYWAERKRAQRAKT